MDYTNLYDFITSSGMIVPKDSEVIAGIQEKFQEIFGADIDLSAETPLGRLIEAYSVLVKSTLGVNAQNANQFNINEATGKYLDSIAQIFGMQRIAGTKTRIAIKCYFTDNSSGTSTIPAGSIIKATTGNAMFSIDSPISNTATNQDTQTGEYYSVGTATAIDIGPIDASVGAGYSIQTAVLGWQSVSCTAVLYAGTNVETDNEFRKRIMESRPIGIGFITHLVSALNRIDGVFSSCVIENNTGNQMIKKGIGLPPHSIYVGIDCIAANDLYDEIATIISRAKPVGTGMVNSGVSEATLISREIQYGYAEAYMQPIYFYQAKKTPIKVNLTFTNGDYAGDDIRGDMERVIIAYVDSVGVGGTLSAPMLTNKLISALNIGIGTIWLQKGGSSIPADIQVEMDAYEAPYSSSGDIIMNAVG